MRRVAEHELLLVLSEEAPEVRQPEGMLPHGRPGDPMGPRHHRRLLVWWVACHIAVDLSVAPDLQVF